MIKGLEKLTLVDYPGKIAATVFTGGCNFRCPWCHNKNIAYENPDAFPDIDEKEILSFLKTRIGKLEGLCITGGEPTLWGDRLLKFMKDVKDLGFLVKLDTNGSNPDFIQEAYDVKAVDYIAMDIKNTFEKYAETIGLKKLNIDSIKKSIKLIKTLFPKTHQFRTTMVPNLVFEKDIQKMEEIIGEKIIRQPFREIKEEETNISS